MNVALRLANSASLMGTDFTVSTNDGEVTLTGEVESEQDRQRAIELARRVRGVRDVDANLVIDPDLLIAWPEPAVDDETLSRRVAAALEQELIGGRADKDWIFGWDIEGPNWEFEVEADEGDITLDGSVGSYAQLLDAVQAARRVVGVRSVDSNLWVDRGYGYPWDYRWWW